MTNEIFMLRMRAKEIRNQFKDATEDSFGHGVSSVDIGKVFHAADDLFEALRTIEDKLEGREE